ncbi:PstC family ABC transporter permease, partial [Microbacterium schleiferi]
MSELRPSRDDAVTDQLAGQDDGQHVTVFDEVADVFLADEVTQIVDEPRLEHPIEGARSLKSKPNKADSVFRAVAYAAGGVTVAIMLAVGLFLSIRAGSALQVAGIGFLFEQQWNPEAGQFGIGAVLFGTVSIAMIAITISLPLSLGTSLLISEVLRGRLKQWAITLVDLMAAVPSVVFGLWGVFFLQENILGSIGRCNTGL